jgi:cell wall assembly regulator SMI1
MSEIATLLNAISEEARKLGVHIGAYMHPPATAAGVEEAAGKLPFDLPPVVADFYLWRNGVRLEGQTCEFRIFPNFVFQSIEMSVETTKAMVLAVDDPEMQWRKSWYALATDLAGDYFAIETSRESQSYGVIFAITSIRSLLPQHQLVA